MIGDTLRVTSHAVQADGIQDRPVELLQRLLRFDTSNPPGEERACIDGFLPMQLPPELPFMRLIHAPDERLPADALEFGTRAISRALERF